MTQSQLRVAFNVCVFLMLAVSALSAEPRKPRSPSATSLKPVAVQILLDRAGFSPGSIDGQPGANTKRAIEAFQKTHNLPPTGVVDQTTLTALGGDGFDSPTVAYTVSDSDVAGPFVKEIPTDMMAKSQLKSLEYTSPVEALGEKFHASPALLRRLNPGARFAAGEQIQVPNLTPGLDVPGKGPVARGNREAGQTAGTAGNTRTTRGATAKRNAGPMDQITIVVSKDTSALTLESADGRILFHAPVTTGSEHDPLPIGKWAVKGISYKPTFNYNPDLFWDADPGHAKAKIPPGPNNPVGLVWIDLSRQHYGIHGTPEPERIGHTESHGCVRLTNWDALKVASMVKVGTPVIFR